MTSPLSLDRRLYGAAQQLLISAFNGADPKSAEFRGAVTEQDAVDAIVLLLAAIQEQLQSSRIQLESGTRMVALLMMIRDFIRPLPPGVGPDGTDLLTPDLAEMVQVVRLTRPSRVTPPDQP